MVRGITKKTNLVEFWRKYNINPEMVRWAGYKPKPLSFPEKFGRLIFEEKVIRQNFP